MGKKGRKPQVDHRKSVAQRKRNGRHTCSSDDTLLQRQLEAQHLSIQPVPSDGNCLFHSLADQLSQYDHTELRLMVVNYMCDHHDLFEPFLEDDEHWEEYTTLMRKDGTWAGHLELQAASCALNTPIWIYQANQPVWKIENGESGQSPNRVSRENSTKKGVGPIRLSFHDGCHYGSVRGNSSSIDKEMPISLLRRNNPPKEEDGSTTPPKETVSGKRNRPCPCGSGRKFKRCCALMKVHASKKESECDSLGIHLQEIYI